MIIHYLGNTTLFYRCRPPTNRCKLSCMQARPKASSYSALPAEVFLAWIKDRVSFGESKASIGHSLGVTGVAVNRWLTKRCGISDTVLMLAELRYRGAVDLAPGLPVGSDPAGG
jgi:hypothetical protein